MSSLPKPNKIPNMKIRPAHIPDGIPNSGWFRPIEIILNWSGKSQLLGLIAVVILAFGTTASAADLYYNRATNPNWFGTTPWSDDGTGGPFDLNWTDGNTAIFGSGGLVTVTLNASVAVTGLTNNSASEVTLQGSGPERTIAFSGGTMAGNFGIGTGLILSGNLTQSSGSVNWGGATSAYNGTYTMAGGILDIGQSTRVGAASNFKIEGGSVRPALNTASPVMGAVSMTSGSLRVGRYTGSFGFNLSISELSGNGGTIGNQGNGDVSNPTNILTINQTTITSFSGTINGGANGGNDRLGLVKSGNGTLTLSGAISNMVRVADLTRNAFMQGDLSTVMSPRTVITWAQNAEIFDDVGFAFRVTFLNKCDELERSVVAEFYQRCFGEELPESSAHIALA